MRYAITGATGFVGGRVAGILRDSGHEVSALVRTPGRASALRDRGVELVGADLADDAALARLLDGADGLFHVAGWYKIGTRDPAEGQRINVDGTQNVLAAAQQAGTPRIVYTSTLAVNSDTHGAVRDEDYRFTGRHLSAYDATKAEAHRIAETFIAAGLPLVIVMPGLVYGPGDTSQTGELVRDAVRGRPTVVPTDSRLCWGYIDDIAQGHVLAMDKGVPGQSYMLAGPEHSLAEAVRLAAQIGDGRKPLVVPGGLVRGLSRVSGVIGRVVPMPAMYSGEALRAGAASYLGSPAKAERELGWSARSLREGMTQTVLSLKV